MNVFNKIKKTVSLKCFRHHAITVINVRDIIHYTDGQNEATEKYKRYTIGPKEGRHQNKEFWRQRDEIVYLS